MLHGARGYFIEVGRAEGKGLGLSLDNHLLAANFGIFSTGHISR